MGARRRLGRVSIGDYEEHIFKKHPLVLLYIRPRRPFAVSLLKSSQNVLPPQP